MSRIRFRISIARQMDDIIKGQTVVYRLLNIMGLRKMDARSVDELKEELEDAAERAAEVLERDRRQFAASQNAALKRRQELQASEDKRKSDAQKAEELRKINAEIDARIKAESRPAVQPVKK